MENKYTKLSELVGDTFTVEKVWGYSFKKFDPTTNKMLMEERWDSSMKGQKWNKVYGLETDKGKLDVKDSQLGQLLEAVSKNGTADINSRTFSVNANMTKEQFNSASKEDKMKIRYYFNATLPTAPPAEQEDEPEEEFELGGIPF